MREGGEVGGESFNCVLFEGYLPSVCGLLGLCQAFRKEFGG